MVKKVPSPCIGVCILEPKWGAFCIGCKRMKLEIENWMYYTDAEKQQIITRIKQLREEDPKDYPDYK